MVNQYLVDFFLLKTANFNISNYTYVKIFNFQGLLKANLCLQFTPQIASLVFHA